MSDSILNDIPEINIVLKSEPVTAVSRKLRVGWSVDPSQELIMGRDAGLFEGIIEQKGRLYIDEVFREKYKGWELPIVRIKCQLKKKEK